MRFLYDTDRVVDSLKGVGVGARLLPNHWHAGATTLISIITYFELYEGVVYGHDPVRAQSRLGDLLRKMDVLPVTITIARRTAILSGSLRALGQLIPSSDLLIAATAIEHDLTLVTGNRRHFDRVPGLRILE